MHLAAQQAKPIRYIIYVAMASLDHRHQSFVSAAIHRNLPIYRSLLDWQKPPLYLPILR